MDDHMGHSAQDYVLDLDNQQRGGREYLKYRIEDLKNLQCLHPPPNPSSSTTWVPPVLGSFKINTDASWNSNSLCCGLAALLRNFIGILHNGLVLTAKANDEEAAESQAILLGLKLAKSLSLSSFSLEADCLSLISALKSPRGSVSWSAISWVRQIKFMAASFSSVNWSWTSREANAAADAAAHLASRLESSLNWVKNPPPSLLHILQSDAVAAPP
ncbi:uncharacterized protein LOC133722675 [Rosa rugosa]|uniref:uncharacterized protein LOC133722675 n=1 Tax=Rosa rugosa TaxID=74645 RepID=UPI002B4079AF|nr:uncharacterized protein LOC133722675 [Rosa rugosa]